MTTTLSATQQLHLAALRANHLASPFGQIPNELGRLMAVVDGFTPRHVNVELGRTIKASEALRKSLHLDANEVPFTLGVALRESISSIQKSLAVSASRVFPDRTVTNSYISQLFGYGESLNSVIDKLMPPKEAESMFKSYVESKLLTKVSFEPYVATLRRSLAEEAWQRWRLLTETPFEPGDLLVREGITRTIFDLASAQDQLDADTGNPSTDTEAPNFVGDEQALRAIISSGDQAPNVLELLRTVAQQVNATPAISPTVRVRVINAIGCLLLILFTANVTTVCDFFGKRKLEEWYPPQKVTKEIREQAREAQPDLRFFHDYRFVGIKHGRPLVVRTSPGIRAPEVGTLVEGSLVYILKQDGDFTLIVWKMRDSDVQLSGWVLSRYLKKFR